MAQTLEEEVNTPKHYRTHESGIEAIEITRHLPGDLSNAWKYGMRYEDKDTPKKDLLKLCWYMNDYHEHFIDVNNEVSAPFKVPTEILIKMMHVMDTEPNETMQELFRLIISIVVEQGIINPCKFKQVLDKVTVLAESFSK
jgi:hypothetical protein